MVIYVDELLSDIFDIESRILTSDSVCFVFESNEVYEVNKSLIEWLALSPLKDKFHTHILQIQ